MASLDIHNQDHIIYQHPPLEIAILGGIKLEGLDRMRVTLKKVISKFLGRNSLESTQIYTHVAGVKQEVKQSYNNIPKYETTQLSEDERG